jgi:hypothetical protein
MVTANSINEAGDPVPLSTGQAERSGPGKARCAPKAPDRSILPSELDGLGFRQLRPDFAPALRPARAGAPVQR